MKAAVKPCLPPACLPPISSIPWPLRRRPLLPKHIGAASNRVFNSMTTAFHFALCHAPLGTADWARSLMKWREARCSRSGPAGPRPPLWQAEERDSDRLRIETIGFGIFDEQCRLREHFQNCISMFAFAPKGSGWWWW